MGERETHPGAPGLRIRAHESVCADGALCGRHGPGRRRSIHASAHYMREGGACRPDTVCRRETRLECTPRPRLPLGARGFASGVGHYPGQAQAALPTALERGAARRARARGRGDRARPCDRLRPADRARLTRDLRSRRGRPGALALLAVKPGELPRTLLSTSGRPGHGQWFFTVPEEGWPVGAQPHRPDRPRRDLRKSLAALRFDDLVPSARTAPCRSPLPLGSRTGAGRDRTGRDPPIATRPSRV